MRLNNKCSIFSVKQWYGTEGKGFKSAEGQKLLALEDRPSTPQIEPVRLLGWEGGGCRWGIHVQAGTF